MDTIFLFIAWAVFGYALAIIERERHMTYPIRPPPPPVRASSISLKHRPDRFACFAYNRWRHNERFDVAWCDHDRREFPALCREYDPKHK